MPRLLPRGFPRRFWRRHTCCRYGTMELESGDHAHRTDPIVGDRERALMEETMCAYGQHLRAVARFQKAVAEFRLAKQQHEQLHAMLNELAASREQATLRHQEVRGAVCDFVRVLRDDARAPEIVVSMPKRTMRSIVLRMPRSGSLLNPEPLLEEAVRWAILAFHD